MTNVNPFGDILAQMQQAKSVYDQTFAGLQQQLHAARQAASVYQNPFPAPNTVMPIQPVTTTPTPEAIPPHVQNISALGEIKSVLEKILEKLPATSVKPETKQLDFTNQKNTNKNESPKN